MGLQPLTMKALLLLFLLTNCLNLPQEITAKAAPKSAPKAEPKAALEAFQLAIPLIGGFPQDEMDMFGEADNPGLMLNGGGGRGVGGGLLTTYRLLPGMNRQLPSTGVRGGGGGGGRGSHSQWNWGNDASTIAGGMNRLLSVGGGGGGGGGDGGGGNGGDGDVDGGGGGDGPYRMYNWVGSDISNLAGGTNRQLTGLNRQWTSYHPGAHQLGGGGGGGGGGTPFSNSDANQLNNQLTNVG